MLLVFPPRVVVARMTRDGILGPVTDGRLDVIHRF